MKKKNHKNAITGHILIICPTNAACDVIERKILNGTQLRAADGSWMDVVLPYGRLTPNVEKEDDALEQQDYTNNLHYEFQQKFPGMSRSRAKTPIIITTFGSLYRFFQNTSNESRPTIRAVFIDEASCVSDMDMAILFSELKGSGMFNVVFVLLGDPMQRTPIVKGKKTWFPKVFEMSLLERMICRSSPSSLPGQNQVVSTLLNVQYRMHPAISALSNVLARREVHDGENTKEQFVIESTRRDQPRSHWMCRPPFEGGFFHVTQTDLSYPIVLFDPYSYSVGGRREFNPNEESYEQSDIEVQAVMSIIRVLKSQQVFSYDMLTICATYSTQVRNLKSTILQWLEDKFPDDERDKIKFSTVAGVQGKETEILIYSAVKGKRRTRRGTQNIPIGMVADLRPLYVVVSRAKCHLYIIGDMDYLGNMANAWYCVTEFVRPTNNRYQLRRGRRPGMSRYRR